MRILQRVSPLYITLLVISAILLSTQLLVHPSFHEIHTIPPQPRTHLLIPANKANGKLCRTLASALLGDYPPPVLINWGLNEGEPEMNGYDMTTGKIWGVLKYLRSLPSQADNDIIIMADAHDVVFQLPLPILLDRYHAINARANARLVRQHAPANIAAHNLTQTILFSAEKYCWPLDHRHPACYAVPPSPLPEDVYGSETDTSVETSRPRWLNSGTVVGPVRDMRVLYEWAHSLWRAYTTGGGDQDYFSYIYGMQELGRQRLRGSKEWVFGFNESFSEDEFIKTHLLVHHADYHLGLDLESQVWQAVNKAWDDLGAVVHDDRVAVDEEDHVRGMEDAYEGRFSFPADIDGIPGPFQDLAHDGSVEDGEEGNLSWRDVSLFSNFAARSIPVAMHHNGDKRKLDEWWHLMWWTGRGRELKEAKIWKSGNPWFSIGTDSGSHLAWEHVCGEHEEYVFGV